MAPMVGNIALSDNMDTSSVNNETPGATVTIDLTNTAKVRLWTASQIETVNLSGSQTSGRELFLVITNDASLGRVITFGTGFKSIGIATGVISKANILHFVSDGTNFYEIARTIGV